MKKSTVYAKTARIYLVRAVSVSIIYQLKLYYNFCLCLASVHLPNPFQLIRSFQLFGHAVSLRQLRHDQLRAVSCFDNFGAILSYAHSPMAALPFLKCEGIRNGLKHNLCKVEILRGKKVYRLHFPRARYIPAGTVSSTLPPSTAFRPRSQTSRMPPAVTNPS